MGCKNGEVGGTLSKAEDFDPDTLERGAERRDTKQTEGEESDALDPERGPQVHLGNPATEEYSFRLFPAGETKERLAPFPLPAPYDNRLEAENAQTRDTTTINNKTSNNNNQ